MFIFRAVFCLFAVGVLCASPASADINAGINSGLNGNQQATHQTNPLPGSGSGGSTDPCANVQPISGGCSGTGITIVTCEKNGTCEKHQSCSSCDNGTSRTQQTDACGKTYFICAKSFNINPGDNILPTNACGAKCNDCIQQDWTTESNGIVQKQITFKCDLDTNCVCQYSNKYRCVTGYYGRPQSANDNNLETKCTRCPDIKGVFGTTDGPGKTNKTDCYMPSNITFTDGIGTYSFATTCNATATATGN